MKRPSKFLRILGILLAGALTAHAQDLDLSGETTVTNPEATSGVGSNGDLSLSGGTAATQEDNFQQSFTSLQEAYDWELGQTKDQVKAMKDRVNKMEEQNFRLWKRIQGLKSNPSISLHGTGRSESYSKRSFGTLNPFPTSALTNYTKLDLMPTGTISKELSWFAIMRIDSNLAAGGSSTSINMPRVTANLNPDFMSAIIGDFDLSWTPFTLWNRNADLDYGFVPGYLQRRDRYEKDNFFVANAPDWPLRGLKVGTQVMWPSSPVMDGFKTEAFVHMLRSGYDNGYVAFRYSGWMTGARAELKARKFLTVGAQGLFFDEPLDTDDPTSTYRRYDATTWAQRYTVGSLTPRLSATVAEDLTVGVDGEGAFSRIWDDRHDASRKVDDWSYHAGPFITYKASTLSVRALNVGYGFYSPMAQLRQRDDYLGSLTKHPVVLSSDIGIDALGRPSAIFKYYNRMTDNVFPYGLATPNRKGFGGELDVKALDKDALSLKAMVYAVKELSDNFVVNRAGTEFGAVDWTPSARTPMREFLYVNVAPKIDIAALAKWGRRLDVGFGVRMESTKSDIGKLDSTALTAGFGVGITKWMEAEVGGRLTASKGREATLHGVYARTAYPYDNTDLGQYVATDLNGKTSLASISLVFNVDRHSKLTLDGALETVTDAYTAELKQHNQTLDLIYEIAF